MGKTTSFPYTLGQGGIEGDASAAPDPSDLPYPEPNKARIKALQDMIAAPAQPMFTPEQMAQRQYANDRDYKIGMLAQLGAGGNEGMQNLGGTLFKNALAQRQPSVTEKGAYDPMTGQFTLNPAAQQEIHRTELGRVEDRDAAQRIGWQQNRQAVLDRALAARQHATDQMNLHMAMGGLGAGGVAGGGMDPMVDALGTYKIDPAQAFARLMPGARAQILAQVQAKYPDYDPTKFSAKKQAAVAFTSGPQGNAMRQFASAGQHLDQLTGLVDAMQTGQSPLINRALLEYQKNTGQTAPTDFEAAKHIVAQEVIKAIVANGSSGVEERLALQHALDGAKTHEQLKGVIAQFRGLMNVQHENLLAQRRAAGLGDDTLPNYQGTGTPAAAPGGGWSAVRE